MKKEKEFSEMSRDEKRKFLSMDMIERLVRVEQTVASHFGDKLKYDQTNYFKSLSKEEQKQFKLYIKKKNGVNKILCALVIVLPVFFLFLLKFNLTGEVIAENIGENNFGMLDFFLIVFLLFSVIIFLYLFIRRKMRDKHFNNHSEVLCSVYKKSRKR